MIFFTICSRNFVGYSGALWSSLRDIYPDLKFYLVLCDDEEGFDTESLQYPVIRMEDLGIQFLEDMKNRYNITELNTSLKPFAFEYIFSLHPGEPVVYLDPDIFVVSRPVELEALFAGGADCVLTPHICEPAEYAEMNDLKFLTYGIYNFGFCALRDTAEVRRLVAWWGRRLEEHCVIDYARGLFVDQKWGDYFPAFVENTKVLRHAGYNVAYWNLSQRRIRCEGGGWTSNGVPLRFVHFSGNRIEDENVFTRHAGQFNVLNTPELVDLLDTYRAAIFRNGQELEDFGNSETFELGGYCIICGDHRQFVTSLIYGIVQPDGTTVLPNWREHLSCKTCGSYNRQRAALDVMDQIALIPREGDLYVTERATAFFNVLQSRWPNIIGSEYFPPETPPGSIVDGVRHEDIQNLSFDENSLDAILSFDVLQHLPFPKKAFEQMYRCLRPNGVLIFTAPFDFTRDRDNIRAILKDDGTIEHLLPEEYHGSPLDMEKGARCFRYFSWGVIAELKSAGFEDAAMFSYWSRDLMHYGDPQFIIFARKR